MGKRRATNGVNYVSNKNIVSLETSWKNNVRLDGGFFPGSGFQTPGDGASGAIRGRLEFGNRQGTLRFVARFENGSTELAKLKSQSTGTAVMTLTYDSNNSLELTWHKVSFATAELGEADGIVTVSAECLPMTHPKSDPPSVGEKAVRRALSSVIELLNVMYFSIYKKKLPAYRRGLSSKLQF